MRPRRVLVLSNSADASGAPIALLRLMRWCVRNDAVEPTFVLRSGGELIDEFRRLGATFLLSEGREDKTAHLLRWVPGGGRVANAGAAALGRGLRALCRRRRIEIVYANTATHSRPLGWLQGDGLPVVTHVHELRRWLEYMGRAEDLPVLIERSRVLLAVSDAVRSMLVESGADAAQVVKAPTMLEEFDLIPDEARRQLRRDVLEVDDQTIVVAACGWPSLIKGADLFLPIAQLTLARLSDSERARVAFRWIGGGPGSLEAQVLVDDAARLRLADQVRVVDRTPEAARLLGAIDVFLSPSREDASPLSALEAAAAGRPTLCFQGAGGAQELVHAAGAVEVPYLDTGAFAVALAELVRAPARREELGARAAEHVRRVHSPDAVGPLMAQIFDGL